MKLLTLFRLLSQGFSSRDPRLEQEAKRMEDEETRKVSAKATALTDFKRVVHYDDGFNMNRWFREEGRGIDVGKIDELEIWQRGEHFRLAVRKQDQWEVYVVIPELTSYQLRRKVV